MRFFHLSDLHLGKYVNEFSMLEDQAYVLKEILRLAASEQPEAVLIAGDVFDRSLPPGEALALFDNFLVALSQHGIQVYVISGNHDSAERLAFAARLMQGAGVFIAPAYEGQLCVHHLEDAHGPIDLCLLPFLRPNMVRRFFPEQEIATWTQAVQAALSPFVPRPSARTVLVAHQFVTGGVTSESEEFSVGGADNVDASVFENFDYVALGHLHGPQRLSRDSLRYAGSPLKYSFSEVKHQKSLAVVDLGPRGQMDIRLLPLAPLRDLVELEGSYQQLISRPFYQNLNREDYFRILLTDEQDQPDALAKLRLVYPRLMRLDYKRLQSPGGLAAALTQDPQAMHPLALYEALYQEQHGQGLSTEQKQYIQSKIEQVWEDEA